MEPELLPLGAVGEVARYATSQIELAELDASRARLDRAVTAVADRPDAEAPDAPARRTLQRVLLAVIAAALVVLGGGLAVVLGLGADEAPSTPSEDSVDAGLAKDPEARLLGIAEGSPVLRVARRAFSGRTPVEVSRSTYRADRFTLWIPMSRQPGPAH